ncbi:Uncharacterised protein [Chlamydia abortus]|uniref:Uncharacterized protein n=2 Tax=Paenibacillus TaxID=44249 RepID=A0A090ZCW8_PAEMA|nr:MULTISPECIES: hypothetical protein [Paenibacillus]SHE14624.1 Uncharacterised protein [Chlamydia abortus]GIP61436.1 hypothetical protein J15TS10_52500 [Paenibacillus woosongensis]KFN08278.1 hypothetical protein DJ90_1672 [Paenibacillus macerans]MBS5910683.1 hypothetical protein [Paenibacillus macerans]GBK61283.1 hypothetical protein PbDSM24746_12870 [Paenibacillus macerans]
MMTIEIRICNRRDQNYYVTIFSDSYEVAFCGLDARYRTNIVISFEKEYYVTSGNTYRVVTTATIKERNRILETATSTSAQVKY